MKRTAALFGLILLLLGQGALSQTGTGPGPLKGFSSSDTTPVTIKADRFEVDLANKTMVLIGHARATQGKRRIYGDRMDVSYSEDWKVKILEAKGNVKVNMDDAFATSDYLKLDNDKQVIYLRGNPRVVQGKQIMAGKEMVYEMKTERLLVSEPRIELRPDDQPPAPAKPPAPAAGEK